LEQASSEPKMNLAVDIDTLTRDLDELARCSDTEAPVITRVVFSESDLRARAFVKKLCASANLTVREDAVGNTFARWLGSEPELAAIGTGSHIDAIPFSGRYDGTVGVLGGLEAIRTLQRANFHPRRSIELLMFTSEEPTRFGMGCLGSRLLAGVLDGSVGGTLKDTEGATLDQLRTAAGFNADLQNVRLSEGYYSAFLELHIEQGPLLEQRGVELGVVSAIAAPSSLRLNIEGTGGHAGSVLMPNRHDAFCAAAEIALALEAAAKSTGAIDTVATCGVCNVFPGLVNGIPSRVRLELDIRDIDEARRDGVIRQLEHESDVIARHRGVRVTIELINRDSPGACDPKLSAVLRAACTTHGLSFEDMVSRAYHDSLFMARLGPVAMLFIPCREGISHRPEEYSSPEAIGQGTLVLAEALATLSAER
jgi:ureidoglycolate amidohydrolase